MKSVDHLVLVGHKASIFDVPRLLFNAGLSFSNKLQEMKVLFSDSLPDLKYLRGQPNNVLSSRWTSNKLSDLYESLFATEFKAHDALEDMKALRKILFTPPLNVSQETMDNRGKSTSPNDAFEQAMFLQRRQDVLQSYNGKLYFTKQGGKDSLTVSMIQKLADAGLAFNTLQELYDKHGVNGLFGVLALPPTKKSPRCQSRARITSNKRIISTILRYFQRSS